MGWTDRRRNRTRTREANRRKAALRTMHYQGDVDPDGYPLDGPGAIGPFKVGHRPQHPTVGNLHELIDNALDASVVDGGSRFAGYEAESRDAWPDGYRWDNRRRR